MDALSFWLVIITLINFVAYSVLIGYYYKGWKQTKEFTIPENFHPQAKVAVLIPARNEEQNIGSCIQAILAQSYPQHLLEIIVIDDHSTDATAEIVRKFNVPNLRVISLADHVSSPINSYKKKAIEIAIASTDAEWIITTDADAIAETRWIETIIAFRESKNAELIAAPVKLSSRERFLEILQLLDFMMLQGITAAAISRQLHVMGNGANLGYSRTAFLAVNGFAGIDDLASGDDMLLMQKIKAAYPGKLFYLKSNSAIVSVRPANTWKEFWNQRIRWASKAGRYEEKNLSFVLLTVYFFNFLLLVLFVLSAWNNDLFLVALVLFFCKTIIEYPFANEVAGFFGERRRMFYFLFMQPVHIIYTVIAGFLGKFGKYQWKGRTVK